MAGWTYDAAPQMAPGILQHTDRAAIRRVYGAIIQIAANMGKSVIRKTGGNRRYKNRRTSDSPMGPEALIYQAVRKIRAA